MVTNTMPSGGIERDSKRTSLIRQNKLQQDSRRRTKEWNLSLKIDEDFPTAVCKYDDSDDYSIVVSGRKFNQPITDYDEEVWDMLVQRVLTLHENAHVIFTDFEDLDERISDKDEKNKRVYHSLHNLLEDGRIEVLIRSVYPTYSTEIMHFRANFMSNNSVWNDSTVGYVSSEDKDTDAQEGVSIYGAVELGLLDKGLFDVGRYDSLLDSESDDYKFATRDDRELFISEIDPLIRDTISEVQSESDSKVANKKIVDFVDKIIEYLNRSDKPGDKKAGERDGESPARPDDAKEQGGPAEVNETPDIEPEEDEKEESKNKHTKISTDEDIEEQIQEVIESEAKSSGGEDDSESDTDALEEILNNSGEISRLNQRNIEDVPNNSKTEHQDQVSPATENARRIRSSLNLSPNSEGKINRGTRRGRVDSASIVRAQIGDAKRYKANQSKEGEVRFNLAIILDRSGSMKSDEREVGIQTVLQTLFALQPYANVQTAVYELYDRKVRRAMPLGRNPDKFTGALTHGKSTGGTPLTDALCLSRERLKLESDANTENRIFVVTDGKPDSKSRYEDELEDTQIPVVGLSITKRSGGYPSPEYYHRHMTVSTNGDGLVAKTTKILSELTETNEGYI